MNFESARAVLAIGLSIAALWPSREAVLSAAEPPLGDQHAILAAFNVLNPAGLYGSTGLDAAGLHYVYPHYGLNSVFVASPPVAAPRHPRTVFARFETTVTGRRLVIRNLSDGQTNRVEAIDGYNPQWFPDGRRLFYETPPANGSPAMWSIEVETGVRQRLFGLGLQYHPPGEPSGAAVLSSTGAEAIYLKFVAARQVLTPFVVSLEAAKEQPVLIDSPCTVDGIPVSSGTLVSSPAPPATVRHMHWSPCGRQVAMFATLQAPGTVGRQGLIIVDLDAEPVGITFIQETANQALDHLENFFISPDGGRVVFNQTVDNRASVFVSLTYESKLTPLGPGLVVAGQVSREAWPLSPWSHDGARLLYQDLDDGSLWAMQRSGGGRTRLTPEGLTSSLQIRSAQWVDLTARAPSDLVVTDVRPQQVIEGASLVVDKPMMVRGMVRLVGPTNRIDRVPMRLETAGASFLVEATVIRHRSATYVLSPDQVAEFERVKDRPLQRRLFYDLKGFTSFNFVPKGLKPRSAGSMTWTVTLDPLARLSLEEDADKTNNELTASLAVKAARQRRFLIQFQPAVTFFGPKTHQFTDAQLRAKAKAWADFVQATYPIPEVRMSYIPSTITIAGAAVSLRTGLGSLSALLWNLDRTVYILPTGALGEIDGLSRPGGHGVILAENAPDYVLAHEVFHTLSDGVAHDSDAAHPSGPVAANGWDVEQRVEDPDNIRRGPKLSLFPHDPLADLNHYSLMRETTGLVRTWLTPGQYRHLLDRWVTGGQDPWLLVARGAVQSDGRAVLLPAYATEGYPEATQTGPFTLETVDAEGVRLDSVDFTLDLASAEPGAETNFTKALPLDPRLAALRLLRDGALLARTDRTPNAPVVEVAPVEDLGNRRMRIRWTATDADGGDLFHCLGYSHDGECWLPLAFDLRESSLEVNLADAPGGAAARIRVMTTDGLNATMAESPSFSVPPKPPSALIVQARQLADAAGPPRFTLNGFAYDPEEGMLAESALTWTSDRDGLLGTGERLESPLSPGNHTLTLRAVDADANVAEISVLVEALVPTGESPQLVHARVSAGGHLEFDLVGGQPGLRYRIQRGDILGDWTDWTTLVRTQSVMRLSDEAPPNAPRRFYRARWP